MSNFLLPLSEKLKTKKIRLLSGFFIITSYFALTSNLATFFSILAASIICTGGIGGGLWLAIAYIIGTVLSLVVNLLAGSDRQELLPDEHRAVERYVSEAKNRKISKGEVKMNLKNVGWDDQLINKIVNSVYE